MGSKSGGEAHLERSALVSQNAGFLERTVNEI
jgi:hypothetical protein